MMGSAVSVQLVRMILAHPSEFIYLGFVTQFCSCGKHKNYVSCMDVKMRASYYAYLFRGPCVESLDLPRVPTTSSTTALPLNNSTHRCGQRLSCKKHQCAASNNICLLSNPNHQCQVVCQKMLSCHKHRCTAVCHYGRCRPCYHIASTVDESCDCGKTLLVHSSWVLMFAESAHFMRHPHSAQM